MAVSPLFFALLIHEQILEQIFIHSILIRTSEIRTSFSWCCFGGMGFELYHLSHTSSRFCHSYFGQRMASDLSSPDLSLPK
jgi:hypothetical protein